MNQRVVVICGKRWMVSWQIELNTDETEHLMHLRMSLFDK